MSYEYSPYKSPEDFRETSVRVTQATSFELHKLWQALHESCSWNDARIGSMPTIGKVGDKPVVLSLRFAAIDGKRTLFWETTSQAWNGEMAEAWIKANCAPDVEVFDAFPALQPIPMQEDEVGAQRELAQAVYFIEANDREAQLVMMESRCDADIKLDPAAYGVKIGELEGQPVVLKLLFATVNTRRIVFWMPGSKVFDFAMGEAWLEANSKLLATTESTVRSDAMNFHSCVHDIDRMNKLEAEAA